MGSEMCIRDSLEGVTKIADVSHAGLYLNKEWVSEPTTYDDINLPETTIIPFKSDSWALGEFLVRNKTGKGIPKRFLKSQSLLDKFLGDQDPILKRLLVIDPNERSYTWDLVPQKSEGCSVM